MKRVIALVLCLAMALTFLCAYPLQASAVALRITQQPASVTVAEGQEIRISFTATGDGLTYKWYFKNKGASAFQLTTTFTGNTYTATMNADRNGRQVYCVVTDKYGNTATTNTVTMTMGASTRVKITQQPASVTVAEGREAKVTFTATGEGLTYKWYFKNKGASAFQLTTTFTGNTYTATMNADRDGRQIYCVVRDKYGNTATTNTVTISMGAGVQITQQPSSVTVAEGQEVRISFTAAGEGLTYKWYFKNKGASAFQLTTTFTGNTYTATMNSDRNGRQVYCVVTDKYGNTATTNTVTMTMGTSTRVQITQQPASVTVAEGKEAKVTFTATGEGLTYKWYFKNKGESEFKLTTTFSGNTYTATMNADRDGRQIYCVVRDKYGNTATTNTVTISMGAGVQITQQPSSVTVAEGEEVKISFTATGEGLTYKWYFKNKGATAFLYTATFSGNTYTTTMNADRDGRQIYCVVTDKYGNTATTNTVVMNMSQSLRITTQPRNTIVDMGVAAAVSVTAVGDGLRYEWYYKGRWGGFTKDQNATTNTYSFTMSSAYEGRQLYCIVYDCYGNSVQSDTVTISSVPYKTVYYGNNNITCVELLNGTFATVDKVDWAFEKVGQDANGDYGFVTRNVVQADAPIRNWDYGDGTYLTQYVNATQKDVDDLTAGLLSKGYTLTASSNLNQDCYSYSFTARNAYCHISYFPQKQEIYLTASKTRAFSPYLQPENVSTQSAVISGATTKLTMIPSNDDGDCYVIQLKNGNFIVFDGGASSNLVDLIEYLEANTPDGQIPVIEAWFITHGHWDHCGWSGAFITTSDNEWFAAGEAASRIRVNGVYFNQTAQQNWEQTVYKWRSDTPETGWRTVAVNAVPSRVSPAVAKMRTETGATTPLYRPQAGQIYYFCGLQVEVPYTQEQIPFCDYQMDLNASSTWYLVRSQEGRTFLDAGDTEDVNMAFVVQAYSSDYDIYAGQLDVMSVFHHGHNLYVDYKDAFNAPLLFLPRMNNTGWSDEATTVYRYFTTRNGSYYRDLVTGTWKRDGLGLTLYYYGQGAYVYDFSTGKVTQVQ